MCHFITLIAPTGDVAAVSAVMKRHGRAAKPIDNPSVRKVLHAGEHQYLTTTSHCDCGTVLSIDENAAGWLEKKLAEDEARMRRKGWSGPKISRALEGRRKAEAAQASKEADSFELWEAIVSDLQQALRLPYVGLLLRFYSGAIDSEVFDASRAETPSSASSRQALRAIKEDQVTILR